MSTDLLSKSQSDSQAHHTAAEQDQLADIVSSKYYVAENKVPRAVLDRFNDVIDDQIMGRLVAVKIYGKTPLDQYFVIIITEFLWYAVRVILEEDHWYLPVTYFEKCFDRDVLDHAEFIFYDNATAYVQKKLEDYSEGKFGNTLRYRVRTVPRKFLENPDEFLKPGDHLQRYLSETFGQITGLGNHEGIYLGDSLVAHINNDDLVVSIMHLNSKEARAKLDPLRSFLSDENQQLRVISHCFKRRYRDDIVAIARALVADEYLLAKYDLLNKNCQHFSALCVYGEEIMSEKTRIIETLQKIGIAVTIPVVVVLIPVLL